jgi:predicted PurR-regulated permease PerM
MIVTILVTCVVLFLFQKLLWLVVPGLLALMIYYCLLDDFVFMPLTIGRKLHIHPLLSVLMFFLGATVAGGTGLVLARPVLGVVAAVAGIVAEVVMDRRLRFRYQAARDLATTWENPKLRGPRELALPTKADI